VTVEGKMDADLYVSILEEEVQPTLEYYGKTSEDIIFQHDNEPKHTSKKAKKWLEDHEYKVLIWPAPSPDFKPTEHLWTYIKARPNEYEEPPKGILELWECVQVKWEKIPPEVCQNLIDSIPRCVQAVYKAKGG
jgi:hypothetical protein